MKFMCRAPAVVRCQNARYTCGTKYTCWRWDANTSNRIVRFRYPVWKRRQKPVAKNGISDRRLLDAQHLSGMKIAGRRAIIPLEGRDGLYSPAMLERVFQRFTLCRRCRLDLLVLTDEVFPLAAVGVAPLALVFKEAAACEGCDGAALVGILEPLLACVPALGFTLPARVEAEVRL